MNSAPREYVPGYIPFLSLPLFHDVIGVRDTLLEFSNSGSGSPTPVTRTFLLRYSFIQGALDGPAPL